MKASGAAFAAATLLSFAAGMGVAQAGDGRGNGEPDVVYPVTLLSGWDGAKRSSETHFGFYKALNGDLDRDGIVVRALGSFGGFDYGNWPNKVDADFWQGDAMVGYQWVRNGFDFAALIGIDYQDYKLTPNDLTNRVRGSEVGFKAVLDLESNGGAKSPIYYAVRGSYSTAFDSYYALARVGANVGRGLFVGPEAWVLGDISGDAQRVGAFALIEYPVSPTIAGQLSFSAGYQFSNDNGNQRSSFSEDGMYGTVRFRMALGREVGGAAPLK